MAALKLVTAPAIEPVTIDEMKAWARIDTTADDDYVVAPLITAARILAETWTRRQFITATWRMSLDSYYTGAQNINTDLRFYQPLSMGATSFGSIWDRGISSIRLPVPPVQSVTTFAYVDTDGTTQTLATSQYTVDTDSEPARITPAFGIAWPPTRTIANAVQITFVAGYGSTTASVPQPIRTAIKMMVAYWYNQREMAAELDVNEMPQHCGALLNSQGFGSYV